MRYSWSEIGRTNLIVHRDITSYNPTSYGLLFKRPKCGFYEESKELHCLTRCVVLKFENLLTSSRYFSELKDLSLNGLAM